MNNLIWALIAWFFTGSTFLLLQNVGKDIKKDLKLQIIYVLLAFIIAGIVSFFLFLVIIFKNTKLENDILKILKIKNIINLIFLGLFILFSYIFLEIALNKGGSVSAQIINLNILIAVIGGFIFFGERLNPVQYGGIVLAIISGGILAGGKEIWKKIKK